MTAWRLADSLATARAELDRLYPRRPKTGQEGTIGNTAHVAEGWTLSDHNPWVTLNGTGIVRAWDIDCTATAAQIAAGESFDPNVLAEYLAKLQRDDFKAFGRNGYVIWNRRITYGGDNEGVWHEYTGSDPHTKHIHVSVGTLPAEFDSTATWNLAAGLGHTATPIPPEDDMADAQTQATLAKIANDTAASLAAAKSARYLAADGRRLTEVALGLRPGKPGEHTLPGVVTPVFRFQVTPDKPLAVGERLWSAYGSNYLVVQPDDGNVVAYDVADGLLWTLRCTGAKSLVVQRDGNVVALDGSGRAVGAIGSAGKPGSVFVVQEDGNVCLYPATPGAAAVWGAGTAR